MMLVKLVFVLLAFIAASIGGVPIKDEDGALITDNPLDSATETVDESKQLQDANLNVDNTKAEHSQKESESNTTTQTSHADEDRGWRAQRVIPDIGRDGTTVYYVVGYNQNGQLVVHQVRDMEHARLIRGVSSQPFPYQNAVLLNKPIQNTPEFRSFSRAPQYPLPYQVNRPSYPNFEMPSYGYGTGYQGYGGGSFGYRPAVQRYGPQAYQPITKSENKVFSKQSKGGYSFYQPPAPKMKFNQWTGPTYSVNKQDTKSSIDYNMLGKLFGKGSSGIKGMFSDWGVNKYGNQDKFTANGGSKSLVNKSRYNTASGPGVQGYSGGASGGFRGRSNANAAPGGYGSASAGSAAYGQTYGGVNQPYGY